MKSGRWVALLAGLMLLPGAAQATVTVSVTPRYSQIVLTQSVQFGATVSGTTNTGVVWQVNNARAGTGKSGKISAAGLYTAPATLPNPAIATITAVSKADRRVRSTATVTLLARASSGQSYYVATTGNDANAGSIGAPWRSIQHAADSAAAGDTVLVRQGVYSEHVTFHLSGNAANGYITFMSYPGEFATLDGAGLDIPQHQWGLFTFRNVSYVIVAGFELRNYETNSVNDVPIGIYVLGAGKSVQLINNSVHDIATTAATTPSKCGSNAFGITANGTRAPDAIDGLAISGNEIFHLKTGCSETMSLNGNVVNFAIISNLVHDNDNIAIGAIGFEGVSNVAAYDQARNGVIRGNTVYNITSFGNPDYGSQYAADGIYIDGGTNIIVEQNLIHHVDLGIEIASEHRDHTSSFVIARNNLIYAGNSAGISIGGYASGRGGTDHCTIVGNTLYGNDTKNTGSGEFQVQFNATNNVFKNNILYATAQNLLVNDFTTSSPEPVALDFNLYFSAGAAANAKWVWQKQVYKGYSNYVTGTGLDTHSPVYSDPRFLALGASPELTVAAGSPARASGVDFGPALNGAFDFAGNKRVKAGLVTLGAYE